MNSIEERIENDNFSWLNSFKDDNNAEDCFNRISFLEPTTPKVSALKEPWFSSTKIFNISLILPTSKQERYQIPLKLELEHSIQEAMIDIFIAFDNLLKKEQSQYKIIEDSSLWELKIAKKNGLPKDYIPSIDFQNLVESVECYDSLVMCPLKESACVLVSSLSTLSSATTKGSSKGNSISNRKDSLLSQASNEELIEKNTKTNTLSQLESKVERKLASHYDPGFPIQKKLKPIEEIKVPQKRRSRFLAFFCC